MNRSAVLWLGRPPGLRRLFVVLVGRRSMLAVCTLLVTVLFFPRDLALRYRGLRVLPRVRWELNKGPLGPSPPFLLVTDKDSCQYYLCCILLLVGVVYGVGRPVFVGDCGATHVW